MRIFAGCACVCVEFDKAPRPMYYSVMYSGAASVCLLSGRKMPGEFPGRRREHVLHYCCTSHAPVRSSSLRHTNKSLGN